MSQPPAPKRRLRAGQWWPRCPRPLRHPNAKPNRVVKCRSRFPWFPPHLLRHRHLHHRLAPVEEAPAAAESTGPGLFDAVEDQYDAQPDMVEDDVAAACLPSAATSTATTACVRHLDGDAAAFVAPRPRGAGTPSPEALARLQAAVSKNPGMRPQAPDAATRSGPARAATRTRASGRAAALRDRVADQPDGGPPANPRPNARHSAAAPRQQPPVTSYDDEPELSADQERIEIPAFLRRQAN